MHHAMRRHLQALTEKEAYELLEVASHLVLSFIDLDNSPYCVPVNFVLGNRTVYIHGAPMGTRSQLIRHNPKISACAVIQDHIVPEKLTSYFKSVALQGTAAIVTDHDEKLMALISLARKYAPEFVEEGLKEAKAQLQYVEVVKISIDEIQAKQSIELVKKTEKP